MYILVALYALSAVYFAGVMVRLMLTLTPVVCILAGIAFSILLDLVLKEDEIVMSPPETEEVKNLYDKVMFLNYNFFIVSLNQIQWLQ